MNDSKDDILPTLSDLMLMLGFTKASSHRHSPSGEARHVMVHVTIDAQHATPLRRALVRDCAGEPWTIRVMPLHDTDRVRLTLILPKSAVKGAIRRLTDLAPSAEISSLLEVPDSPSDAWRDMMNRDASPHAYATGRSASNATPDGMLASLLSAGHVLLGPDLANRDALFDTVGKFVSAQYGLPFTDINACLAAREALGSTALGEGVAVPHGQIEALHQPIALYIRPSQPIPFDAPDGKPVTDVIALLVPERVTFTHLHLLGEVAQRFCDHRFRDSLHRCTNAAAVCRLFAEFPAAGMTH